MSLTYASTLVCPKCKCGTAMQSRGSYDTVKCPRCGATFRLVEAKAEKRKRR